MVDSPETIGSQPLPLGIPPKGIPPTDRIGYQDLVARGKQRPLATLDAREFGAVGDGSHDDAPALLRGLEAVKKADGALLYLPAGVYVCRQQLTMTGSPVAILGAGRAQTVLQWPESGGGIKITQSDGGDQTIVRDLSLETTVSGGGGTALEIVGPGSPGNNHLIIQDITIRNANWTKGIVVTDQMQSRIEGVRISGLMGTTTHGIHLLGQCTDSLLSRCHIDHVGRAILVEGTTEGIAIDHLVAVICDRGVDIDQSSGRAWAAISDSHINARSFGVYIDNHVECLIHNNMIYRDPAGTGDFYGIRMIGLNDRSRITSNIINSLNTTGTRRGIQIDTGRWVLIADNILRNCNQAIFLASGTSDCLVHDNYRIGGTTTVVNNGSTPSAQIHDNFP